jgi:hypothetical protein
MRYVNGQFTSDDFDSVLRPAYNTVHAPVGTYPWSEVLPDMSDLHALPEFRAEFDGGPDAPPTGGPFDDGGQDAPTLRLRPSVASPTEDYDV